MKFGEKRFIINKSWIDFKTSFTWISIPASIFIWYNFNDDLFVVGFCVILGGLSILTNISSLYGNITDGPKLYKDKLTIEILEQLDFPFDLHIDKPFALINRRISRYSINKTYSCRICQRTIGQEEFHLSSMAVKNPKKTCIDCMRKSDLYEVEFKYINNFNLDLIKFENDFKEINRILDPNIIVEDKDIQSIFFDSIKQLRSKKYPQT